LPADFLYRSGLDANGALSIVRLLRKLADESGIAIFCTIHQPSAVLIQDFDDMLLLSQTGREVYFGPIGEGGKTVIDYFERNGASPASSGMNPAEYVLETIHDAPGDRSWPEIWKSSPESQAVLEEIESLIINTKDLPILRELRTLEYAMPLSTQIAGVTKRVWLHFWRNASYGVSKMYSNISMALIAGVLFLQSGHTVQELQSRMFAVFVLLILSPMILTSIQPKFLEFARLYETRERNSRIYSSTAWITAIVVVEILYAILGSILFFFPWYFMIGLTYSEAGFVFFFVVLFQIWIPHIAMWTAAAFPDITLLSVVNPFIFVVTNGFTGILVTYDAMPQFYSSWLYWANPLTYVVRGILAAILHNVPVICSKKELVTFTPPAGMTCGAYAGEWLRTSPHALGYILDHNTTAQCEYCQFSSGDGYLKVRNMDYETRWRDLGVFCVFIVSNVILIYGLYWVFREIRWSRIWRRFG
jgi:ABC-type multidrug transport system permease subunit